ncbi:MAG: hypothetical protein DRO65_00810, partial [Candidatus Altiarchaeales archaeon]
ADESLWLPKHYGSEIRDKGGIDSAISWEIPEIIDFVFPRKYQPKYHEIACKFLEFLLEKEYVSKKEIRDFLHETGYSRSTLENKIIPKLVRFGILKRERELVGKIDKKRRPLVLRESLTFSSYLSKIANEWRRIVETSRFKRRKSKH